MVGVLEREMRPWTKAGNNRGRDLVGGRPNMIRTVRTCIKALVYVTLQSEQARVLKNHDFEALHIETGPKSKRTKNKP